MSLIIVDGTELDAPPPRWATWRDLLGHLDGEGSGGREMVTAVRLDGVDEPAFRDPAVLARRLDDIAVIEVERGTAEDLVRASVDEAGATLAALSAAARPLADRFRGVNIGAANADLVDFAEALSALVATVRAIALALGADLRELRCEGAPASDVVAEAISGIDCLIRSQQAGDWLTVADTIEYEVAPALARWQLLLDRYSALCSGDACTS